jgi:hypothetical protein
MGSISWTSRYGSNETLNYELIAEKLQEVFYLVKRKELFSKKSAELKKFASN